MRVERKIEKKIIEDGLNSLLLELECLYSEVNENVLELSSENITCVKCTLNRLERIEFLESVFQRIGLNSYEQRGSKIIIE